MEYERNWANVITILVMAIIPILLNPILNIPEINLFFFPCIGRYACPSISSKRYAVTKDRLSADGFFLIGNIVWKGWKGGTRIVLQRRVGGF